MKIELTELKRITSRAQDINTDLDRDLTKMSTLLDSIVANVCSSELASVNKNLVDAVTGVADKVRTNLPKIIEFLNAQIGSYTETNESAKEQIDSLVSMIDGAFKSENGE